MAIVIVTGLLLLCAYLDHSLFLHVAFVLFAGYGVLVILVACGIVFAVVDAVLGRLLSFVSHQH